MGNNFMKNSFKIAACQMMVIDNKEVNVNKAVSMIKEAAQNNAKLVILPEMFNCPYDNQKFREYSENRENSKTLEALKKSAIECKIFLVAGSIPESEDEKIYNSSFIISPEGKLIGFHRKLHLFDIDVPDGIAFKESEIISPGSDITVINTELCKLGVAICYDLRFPELFRLMTLKGVELMVIPGAFNMTTGPAHWDPINRARAIDNQVYLAAVSPARNKNASYEAYGHSMIIDPWGEVLAQAGFSEEIIYAEIEISHLKEIRNQIPLLRNRRSDIYDVIEK